MNSLERVQAGPADVTAEECETVTATSTNPVLQERWVVVCAAITAVMGIAGYALLPVSGMVNRPSFATGLLWLTLAGTIVLCHLLFVTIKLLLRGQERPSATIWSMIDRRQVKIVSLGSAILALNLTFFVIIKAQLGQVVAFSADPLLAGMDAWLFGTDPWLLLEWFKHPGMAAIYHRGWFLWLAFVIYFVLRLPPSREKDRLLISYVLMWSAFGPMVHLMLPAAGPIFYDDLGIGPRFSDMTQAVESQTVGLYLWTGYVNREFNPAGGISAMPSLHLTTMCWTIIAMRNTRWLAFAVAFTGYIFIGSIVIGWHYAVDGLAGAIGAALCYWAADVQFADLRRNIGSWLASRFGQRAESSPAHT